MIISHKYKFLFFCPTGNCATTSIYKALLPFHDENKVERIYESNFEHPLNKNPKGMSDPHEGVFNKKLIVSKHIPPSRFFGFNVFKDQDFENYTKFAVVRNPWDWCLSVFLKSASEAGSFLGQQTGFKFEAELLNITLNMIYRGKNFYKTQYDTVSETDKESYITDFLKFENLNDDFNQICSKLNLPPLSLGHEQNNKNTAQKKYQKYYTETSREIVAKRFKKDIEIFNYTF